VIAAVSAVAVGVVITAGQQRATETGAKQAPARPAQSAALPSASPTVPHRFYVLVKRLPGLPDDAGTAEKLAAQVRAKGFPATVISSHADLPPNTGLFWIAVLSGKFPSSREAEAQVVRLRQAGFVGAEVLDVACDDLLGEPIPIGAC
jgi:SPOR domain